jgi:hypothetical protein
MITSFRDHITEELIAAVKVAELRSKPLPRCDYTEVLAGDSGEASEPCASLATHVCSAHGEICEFHAVICVLGVCTDVQELRRMP